MYPTSAPVAEVVFHGSGDVNPLTDVELNRLVTAEAKRLGIERGSEQTLREFARELFAKRNLGLADEEKVTVNFYTKGQTLADAILVVQKIGRLAGASDQLRRTAVSKAYDWLEYKKNSSNPFRVDGAFYRPKGSEDRFRGIYDAGIGAAVLIHEERVNKPWVSDDGKRSGTYVWEIINVARLGDEERLVDVCEKASMEDKAEADQLLMRHSNDPVEQVTDLEDSTEIEDDPEGMLLPKQGAEEVDMTGMTEIVIEDDES
jgi:hypothetical protein